MKLDGKKALAAKTFYVGKNKIVFVRPEEIKEAITKQDMRELLASGAIRIKEQKGSRKKVKRTTRRRHGKIKKTVRTRKTDYMTMTRKLRAYIKQNKEKIGVEKYRKLRKEIKMRLVKNLAHLKEAIKND